MPKQTKGLPDAKHAGLYLLDTVKVSNREMRGAVYVRVTQTDTGELHAFTVDKYMRSTSERDTDDALAHKMNIKGRTGSEDVEFGREWTRQNNLYLEESEKEAEQHLALTEATILHDEDKEQAEALNSKCGNLPADVLNAIKTFSLPAIPSMTDKNEFETFLTNVGNQLLVNEMVAKLAVTQQSKKAAANAAKSKRELKQHYDRCRGIVMNDWEERLSMSDTSIVIADTKQKYPAKPGAKKRDAGQVLRRTSTPWDAEGNEDAKSFGKEIIAIIHKKIRRGVPTHKSPKDQLEHKLNVFFNFVLKKADADGSGDINKIEFVNFMNSQTDLQSDKSAAVFELMDGYIEGSPSDNILSRQELIRCLTDIEFPPAPKRQRVGAGEWDEVDWDDGGALHSTQSIEAAQTLASSAAS